MHYYSTSGSLLNDLANAGRIAMENYAKLCEEADKRRKETIDKSIFTIVPYVYSDEQYKKVNDLCTYSYYTFLVNGQESGIICRGSVENATKNIIFAEHRYVVITINDIVDYTKEELENNKKRGYTKLLKHAAGHFAVLDTEAGNIVYETKTSYLTIENLYVYKNIIKHNKKYIYIPTGDLVLDAGYNSGAEESIADYNTIKGDNYIVFEGHYFNGKYNAEKVVKKYPVMLNLTTGEVTRFTE